MLKSAPKKKKRPAEGLWEKNVAQKAKAIIQQSGLILPREFPASHHSDIFPDCVCSTLCPWGTTPNTRVPMG